MKKILFLIAITFIINFANAQSKYGAGSMPFSKNGEVIFSEVVPAEGMTAKQLYSNARIAIFELFKSYDDIVQIDDPENGILIIDGIYDVGEKYINSYVVFSLKFSFKDDRYKIDMSNIRTKTIWSDGDVSIYVAEDMTDENCLKNGVCRKTGFGIHRKRIIDTKEQVFEDVKRSMYENINRNNNWTF